MASASKRIARLKRIDRAAVFVITLGGLSVVVGVLGILVFIAAEALPMFRSAGLDARPAVTLADAAAEVPDGMRAVATDEYGRISVRVEPDGTLKFRNLNDGSVAQVVPIPGLTPGTAIVSSSRSVLGEFHRRRHRRRSRGADDGAVHAAIRPEQALGSRRSTSVTAALRTSTRATAADPAGRLSRGKR